MKRLAASAGLCLLVAGCGADGEEIRVSGGEPEDNRKVQEILGEEEQITSAVVVFVKEDLLVGVEVSPLNRYRKAKIEEELAGKMEKAFPDETVTLSADLKIYWETDKLEEIKEEDKLHKKVETIKSLSKEET